MGGTRGGEKVLGRPASGALECRAPSALPCVCGLVSVWGHVDELVPSAGGRACGPGWQPGAGCGAGAVGAGRCQLPTGVYCIAGSWRVAQPHPRLGYFHHFGAGPREFAQPEPWRGHSCPFGVAHDVHAVASALCPRAALCVAWAHAVAREDPTNRLAVAGPHLTRALARIAITHVQRSIRGR